MSISKALCNFCYKHGSSVLTAFSVIGVGVTATLAVRATIKVIPIIEQKKKEASGKLTPVDVVKTVWKPFLPVAIGAVCTATSIVATNCVSLKKQAVLASICAMSETALFDYTSAVKKVIPEKEITAINDEIASAKVKNAPPSSKEIIFTNKGSTLCHDSLSGQPFYSDMEAIRKAVNNANALLIADGHITLNDLYYELGLKNTDVGYNLGWRVDKGLIDVGFSAQLSENGVPCLVMYHNNRPEYYNRN